jgi:hypothetical protein
MRVIPPSALSFGTPLTLCVLEPGKSPRVYGAVGTMLNFLISPSHNKS